MLIASCVAAPGVRAIVFDVAPVSDGTLKPSVKLEGVVPVIASPANVATQAAFVTTLVAPPSTPDARRHAGGIRHLARRPAQLASAGSDYDGNSHACQA